VAILRLGGSHRELVVVVLLVQIHAGGCELGGLRWMTFVEEEASESGEGGE
jgi:hypothetical protein